VTYNFVTKEPTLTVIR